MNGLLYVPSMSADGQNMKLFSFTIIIIIIRFISFLRIASLDGKLQ